MHYCNISYYAVNVPHIDYIAAIAHDESRLRQSFGKRLKRTVEFELAYGSMEYYVVLYAFNVVNIPLLNAVNGIRYANFNRIVKIIVDVFYCLFHLERKRKIVDGLYDKVKGIYLVPLNCKTRHMRNENYCCILVRLADDARRLHAVYPLHLYVEKDYIVGGVIVL